MGREENPSFYPVYIFSSWFVLFSILSFIPLVSSLSFSSSHFYLVFILSDPPSSHQHPAVFSKAAGSTISSKPLCSLPRLDCFQINAFDAISQ